MRTSAPSIAIRGRNSAVSAASKSAILEAVGAVVANPPGVKPGVRLTDIGRASLDRVGVFGRSLVGDQSTLVLDPIIIWHGHPGGAAFLCHGGPSAEGHDGEASEHQSFQGRHC